MNILIRGGGDLASGVAVRLWRVGLRVVITEIQQPMAVRRKVSFSEAVYNGETKVEDIKARLIDSPEFCNTTLDQGIIPVLVDPELKYLEILNPPVLIDARMTKRKPLTGLDIAPLVIGLGPGFIARENCHAVIETMRGHTLGRVIWSGEPQADTGIPEVVANHSYRLALGSILLFFLIGMIFMAFIKDPHKRYVAGERAPYPGIYDKKVKKVEDQ